MSDNLSADDVAAVQRCERTYNSLRDELAKVIVGQPDVIEQVLIAVFARGHALLEGVPGLAKTLLVSSLAQALHLSFKRIQFTPDLMPSDVTGTDVIQENLENGSREYRFLPGPLFANMILADEINRTPPKTQAAMLEAMQERQVSAGGRIHKLPDPFFVLATQNPLEQEGTYPLPEAQLDRFMLKCVITYPTMEEENLILRQQVSGEKVDIQPVVSLTQIRAAQQAVRSIYLDEKIEQYILRIVFATRDPAAHGLPQLAPLISYGGSPRATINLALAAKAFAFLQKRAFVIPEDVRAVVQDVLRHRIGLTYEAEAENMTPELIIAQLMQVIAIP